MMCGTPYSVQRISALSSPSGSKAGKTGAGVTTGMTGADGGVTTCTGSEPHALSVRIER